MTDEEKIFADLDSETLKKQGMNAFEAMYAQLKAKNKYIAELEAIIADKEDNEVYWSPAGLMQAKQVGKYLGLKYGQVVEMGHTGKLKMKREGKKLIFFKDDVLRYERELKSEAGLIPKLKFI